MPAWSKQLIWQIDDGGSYPQYSLVVKPKDGHYAVYLYKVNELASGTGYIWDELRWELGETPRYAMRQLIDGVSKDESLYDNHRNHQLMFMRESMRSHGFPMYDASVGRVRLTADEAAGLPLPSPLETMSHAVTSRAHPITAHEQRRNSRLQAAGRGYE